MLDNVVVEVHDRSTFGKNAARRMRKAGRVPAVVYGRGEITQSLTLSAHEFERLMSRIHAATTVISLEVEGDDAKQVLIREIQKLLREFVKPSGNSLAIFDRFRACDLARDDVVIR